MNLEAKQGNGKSAGQEFGLGIKKEDCEEVKEASGRMAVDELR